MVAQGNGVVSLSGFDQDRPPQRSQFMPTPGGLNQSAQEIIVQRACIRIEEVQQFPARGGNRGVAIRGRARAATVDYSNATIREDFQRAVIGLLVPNYDLDAPPRGWTKIQQLVQQGAERRSPVPHGNDDAEHTFHGPFPFSPVPRSGREHWL